MYHLITALFMGAAIPCFTYSIFQLDGITIKISDLYFWIPSIIIGSTLGFFMSFFSHRKGSFDNWKSWSSIANNKKVNYIILLFSLSPFIISSLKLFNLQYKTPLTFYLYWICGLSLFFFLLLYKALAPTIFKYIDYDDFYKKSESFINMRSDAKKLIAELIQRKADKNLNQHEIELLDDDMKILEQISNNKIKSKQDAFEVMRNRSANCHEFKRSVVAAFLLIPAFILIILFIRNVYFVGKEAHTIINNGQPVLIRVFENNQS